MITRFILGFVAYLGIGVLSAHVIAMLWGWFIVPTFGLAPLSIPAAFGLGLFVRYMTYSIPKYTDEKKSEEEQWTEWIYNIVLTLLVMGFISLAGYIVHLWM